MGNEHIVDSGHRETYSTGAQRDNRSGKGRYDLISPIFMHQLALRLEGGAKKYSAHNWARGMPLSRFVDAILRHTMQIIAGEDDEDHASAVAFNIMAFIHIKEMTDRGVLPSELNDMPDYIPPDPRRSTDVLGNRIEMLVQREMKRALDHVSSAVSAIEADAETAFETFCTDCSWHGRVLCAIEADAETAFETLMRDAIYFKILIENAIIDAKRVVTVSDDGVSYHLMSEYVGVDFKKYIVEAVELELDRRHKILNEEIDYDYDALTREKVIALFEYNTDPDDLG